RGVVRVIWSAAFNLALYYYNPIALHFAAMAARLFLTLICMDFLLLPIILKNVLKENSMIHLETDMEGKRMSFGHAQETLKKYGFNMGGSWEYDSGIFDAPGRRRNDLCSNAFSSAQGGTGPKRCIDRIPKALCNQTCC